jgi:molybdate transport system ATP-binding protein
MALEVDLSVDRGGHTVEAAFMAGADETVAILGPNGAGKSTIVEAVAGLVPEARGRLTLDGERIDGLPPERRPIGIAFQDGVLFPHLSALENVAFPGRGGWGGR